MEISPTSIFISILIFIYLNNNIPFLLHFHPNLLLNFSLYLHHHHHLPLPFPLPLHLQVHLNLLLLLFLHLHLHLNLHLHLHLKYPSSPTPSSLYLTIIFSSTSFISLLSVSYLQHFGIVNGAVNFRFKRVYSYHNLSDVRFRTSVTYLQEEKRNTSDIKNESKSVMEMISQFD